MGKRTRTLVFGLAVVALFGMIVNTARADPTPPAPTANEVFGHYLAFGDGENTISDTYLTATDSGVEQATMLFTKSSEKLSDHDKTNLWNDAFGGGLELPGDPDIYLSNDANYLKLIVVTRTFGRVAVCVCANNINGKYYIPNPYSLPAMVDLVNYLKFTTTIANLTDEIYSAKIHGTGSTPDKDPFFLSANRFNELYRRSDTSTKYSRVGLLHMQGSTAIDPSTGGTPHAEYDQAYCGALDCVAIGVDPYWEVRATFTQARGIWALQGGYGIVWRHEWDNRQSWIADRLLGSLQFYRIKGGIPDIADGRVVLLAQSSSSITPSLEGQDNTTAIDWHGNGGVGGVSAVGLVTYDQSIDLTLYACKRSGSQLYEGKVTKPRPTPNSTVGSEIDVDFGTVTMSAVSACSLDIKAGFITEQGGDLTGKNLGDSMLKNILGALQALAHLIQNFILPFGR